MGASLLALAKSIYYIFAKLCTVEDKHPKYTKREAFPKKMLIRDEIR